MGPKKYFLHKKFTHGKHTNINFLKHVNTIESRILLLNNFLDIALDSLGMKIGLESFMENVKRIYLPYYVITDCKFRLIFSGLQMICDKKSRLIEAEIQKENFVRDELCVLNHSLCEHILYSVHYIILMAKN